MRSGKKKRAIGSWGIILFFLGTLVGLALAVFMIWADLEARLFDPSMSGEQPMRIRCPVLMGRDESVTVSASFDNPLDREARYVVRTNISDGYVTLMRQMNSQLTLPPGEKQQLEWEVIPADAAYGLFALVKVHRFSFYPLPAQQGSCGIVFVDVPLPGGLILAALLAVTLLGMGGGYYLWARANQPLTYSALDTRRMLIVFSALVGLGLFLGFANSWLLGVVVVAISLLLIVVVVAYRLEKRRD